METQKPTLEQPRFGYKVFNSDFRCRDHQFSENSEHKIKGKPKICQSGFHFCPKAVDCFNYYDFTNTNIVCEIEVLGDLDTEEGGDKWCTNHIRIGKRLSWFEVLGLVNSGKNNTGKANTGNQNTGNQNTGNQNTGNQNTGNRNTGNQNTGHWNTGDWNTGNQNTGNQNTGHWNTGHRNTGDQNTGDQNTGNRNTGHWNTGNDSTGIFCTDPNPYVSFFNKPSDWTSQKFRDSEANYLRQQVKLTEWIWWSQMTAEEREAMPRAETQDGYLKVYDYKEAHRTWWNELDSRQRAVITDLPNFSKEIFTEVTGIEI